MTIEAVIFDWGGTLTPVAPDRLRGRGPGPRRSGRRRPRAGRAELLQAAKSPCGAAAATSTVSATVADLFLAAELDHDPDLLTEYRDFWEPHTLTDPQVAPMLTALREAGLKVGVLSNTLWPREWHRDWFARDGVLDLIDGDVYSSEIPWTKPSPEAFRAAMEAIGVSDPAACVYVGDRLFDDVYGAQNAGLRAIHIPHSDIPAEQVGHTEGVPDAIAHELAEIPEILRRWA